MIGPSLFFAIFGLICAADHGARGRQVVSQEYYDILGVKPEAEREEIRKAFRKFGKENKPDTNDPVAECNFLKYGRAYFVLGDPQRRSYYDIHGDDYYLVLGVNRTASRKDISDAFQKLEQQHNSDAITVPNSKCTHREIEKAYFVLGHDERRKYYDKHGEDYYAVLSVDREASKEKISRAFRAVAAMYHPDKTECPCAKEKFLQIQKAHFVLGNDQRRDLYDVYGEKGLATFYNYEESILFSKYVLSTTKWIKNFLTNSGIGQVVRFILSPVGWAMDTILSVISLGLTSFYSFLGIA